MKFVDDDNDDNDGWSLCLVSLLPWFGEYGFSAQPAGAALVSTGSVFVLSGTIIHVRPLSSY